MLKQEQVTFIPKYLHQFPISGLILIGFQEILMRDGKDEHVMLKRIKTGDSLEVHRKVVAAKFLRAMQNMPSTSSSPSMASQLANNIRESSVIRYTPSNLFAAKRIKPGDMMRKSQTLNPSPIEASSRILSSRTTSFERSNSHVPVLPQSPSNPSLAKNIALFSSSKTAQGGVPDKSKLRFDMLTGTFKKK